MHPAVFPGGEKRMPIVCVPLLRRVPAKASLTVISSDGLPSTRISSPFCMGMVVARYPAFSAVTVPDKTLKEGSSVSVSGVYSFVVRSA